MTDHTYNVTFWMGERAACEPALNMTAEQAINAAYNHVGSMIGHVAHIFPSDSLSGIYIARPSDEQAATREEMTARLLSWKWTR